MSRVSAISGCFADYRLVKSRSVIQLIIEVPVEHQADAFAALGYPVPGTDIHVALARLVPPAGETRPQDAAPPVSSRSEQGKARYASGTDRYQALVRAARYPMDARFQAWVSDAAQWGACTKEDAAQYIRDVCGVGSRSEIEHNDGAYERFLRMETAYKLAAGLMAEAR